MLCGFGLFVLVLILVWFGVLCGWLGVGCYGCFVIGFKFARVGLPGLGVIGLIVY